VGRESGGEVEAADQEFSAADPAFEEEGAVFEALRHVDAAHDGGEARGGFVEQNRLGALDEAIESQVAPAFGRQIPERRVGGVEHGPEVGFARRRIPAGGAESGGHGGEGGFGGEQQDGSAGFECLSGVVVPATGDVEGGAGRGGGGWRIAAVEFLHGVGVGEGDSGRQGTERREHPEFPVIRAAVAALVEAGFQREAPGLRGVGEHEAYGLQVLPVAGSDEDVGGPSRGEGGPVVGAESPGERGGTGEVGFVAGEEHFQFGGFAGAEVARVVVEEEDGGAVELAEFGAGEGFGAEEHVDDAFGAPGVVLEQPAGVALEGGAAGGLHVHFQAFGLESVGVREPDRVLAGEALAGGEVAGLVEPVGAEARVRRGATGRDRGA
jgi:hypothetical protein